MSTPIPSAAEQKQRIEYLREKAKRRQKAGSPFFLVSTAWFGKWEAFINEKLDAPPGPVDNSNIIEEKKDVVVINSEVQLLKKDKVEGNDFVIISKYEWEQLIAW